MDINKNHIGTDNYFWRQVASRMKAQYSHGSLTEKDFKAIAVYPLLHTTINSIQAEQTATMQFTIMIADQNINYSNDFQGLDQSEVFQEYGYTENANYAFVLQEMYIRLTKEMEYQEQQMFNSLQIQKPYTLTPMVEDLDAILTGFTADVSLDIINPIVTDGWC